MSITLHLRPAATRAAGWDSVDRARAADWLNRLFGPAVADEFTALVNDLVTARVMRAQLQQEDRTMICTKSYGCSGVDGDAWDASELDITEDEVVQAARGRLTAGAWERFVTVRAQRELAGMTDEERAAVYERAVENLGDDWWDGLFGDEQDPVAVAFLQRFDPDHPEAELENGRDEEFERAYQLELVRELRLGRGYCPHDRAPKWPYGKRPEGPVLQHEEEVG